MEYGDKPKVIGTYDADIREMMFYQDMLIKMPGTTHPVIEQRLNCFSKIIGAAVCDFIADYGLNAFNDVYVYISAKHLFIPKGKPFNRPGWHADGFLSEDINYIWSNNFPTVFNFSKFNLPLDDKLSMEAMDQQALPENNYQYPVNTLLRLNQYNIHRVADADTSGMRGFIKVTFSADKYDLQGNTHNYMIDYDWDMKPRAADRNIPQSKLHAEKY
jgi:hypothetical protein